MFESFLVKAPVKEIGTHPMDTCETNGYDMRAPVRRRRAGAVARRYAAPIEGHGHVVKLATTSSGTRRSTATAGTTSSAAATIAATLLLNTG